MQVVITDGGRKAAGYKGKREGDCVFRALSLATGNPYRQVYERCMAIALPLGLCPNAKKVYSQYLTEVGWVRVATMGHRTGIQVHMTPDELPAGAIITELSSHLCAVINGVVYDNHDPTNSGLRGVYGYWKEGA